MNIATFLAANAVSIVLAIASAVLCFRSKEGWGWFLFAALLTFSGSSAISALDGSKTPVEANQPVQPNT